MDRKLVAIAAGAFGYGALLSWAVTADHFDAKIKRNQGLFAEMFRRKNAEITELTLKNNPPQAFNADWDPEAWVSPTTEEVQAEAEKVAGDILGLAEEGSGLWDENVSELEREMADVETDVAPEEIASSDNEIPPGETPEQTRSNLQSLIDKYTANPDDVDTFVARAGRVIEHSKEIPPFVISRESYANDPEEGDDYAKITLTYYSKDRILVDDDEDVIDEVNDYVGWKSLSSFGGESGDPDTVFVRNRRLLTDFEVVREEEDDPPIHVRYGMSREEFNTNRAAGVIKFRDTDSD